jgi:penicillin-binding protein 1A
MKKKVKKTKNNTGKYLRIFWLLFAGMVAAIALFFFLITQGVIGYLPPVNELQNPKNKYASEIYSSDMQELGRYFLSKENRVNVKYSELSKNLTDALIATEDVRYLDHAGIDGWALGRVLIFTAILQNQSSGGGSTITQQLAKLLYTELAEDMQQRILQKPVEWVIAVKLEKLYTKEEIIEMYFNKFDFLNNAVGIKSAAMVYFSKQPSELSVQEAATLIGMCKNPSFYNPVKYNECTRERRNVVLDQMQKAEMLTEAERDSLAALPLTLHYNKVDHKLGLAAYFREYLRRTMTAKEPDKDNYASWQTAEFSRDSLAWATDPLYGWANKNRKADGSPYNIYTDGLKIYTTIDSRMQHYAEEAVKEHITDNLQAKFFKEKSKRSDAPFSRRITKAQGDSIIIRTMRQTDRYRSLKKAGKTNAEINKIFNTSVEMRVYSAKGIIDTTMTPLDSIRYKKYFLRCGFMSMDPFNGQVKAYVGGPDFSYFQYDMVTEGRRQVGSTIKPFLYTLAMEEGMFPCDIIEDMQPSITLSDGSIWSPRRGTNAKSTENHLVTLLWGLKTSNNWISARLLQRFSPQSFVTLLHSFGITGHIDPVVSLCLGPAEVSVAEMVSAYTSFPNKGMRVNPLYVTRIEDNNGNVLSSFTPVVNEIFSEQTSYKMLTMLQAVVNEGTGQRLRGSTYAIKAQMGGKTGTTQNNSDGWFMGVTPRLVSGVWVGGEERSIHFDYTSDGQGANMSLPVFALYMKKIYADESLGYTQSERFDIPASFNPEEGCQDAMPIGNEIPEEYIEEFF